MAIPGASAPVLRARSCLKERVGCVRLLRGRAHRSWGEPGPNGAAFMEDKPSGSADRDPGDACQDCGSRYVQHRSYVLVGDQREGKLVLLCDNCHRERFGA